MRIYRKRIKPLKHFVSFLLFLALFAACEGDDAGPFDSGAAYFPLQKGIFQVYSVHEVKYHDAGEPEIYDYDLMTEVVDSFPSIDGQGYTFVVHRSRRFAGVDPWEIVDTWSVRRDGNRMIVAEGNLSIVKMLLPVREGVKWDGNIYNSLGEDIFQYGDVGMSMEVNGMTFEKTMTVEQELNEDVIVYYDARREVYAADAGMVYKEVIQLNYCSDDHCLGQQKIEHGTDLKMEIKEYGKR